MPPQAQILTAGTLVDIDSDGDLDLALNSSHKQGGLFVYENNSNDRTSTPSFKLVSASFYSGNTIENDQADSFGGVEMVQRTGTCAKSLPQHMQNLLIWIKTEILIYLFQGT